MHCCLLETRLGGGSQVHQQEELGQIPDAVGERDQNTQGKSVALRKNCFPGVQWIIVIRLMHLH